MDNLKAEPLFALPFVRQNSEFILLPPPKQRLSCSPANNSSFLPLDRLYQHQPLHLLSPPSLLPPHLLSTPPPVSSSASSTPSASTSTPEFSVRFFPHTLPLAKMEPIKKFESEMAPSELDQSQYQSTTTTQRQQHQQQHAQRHEEQKQSRTQTLKSNSSPNPNQQRQQIQLIPEQAQIQEVNSDPEQEEEEEEEEEEEQEVLYLRSSESMSPSPISPLSTKSNTPTTDDEFSDGSNHHHNINHHSNHNNLLHRRVSQSKRSRNQRRAKIPGGEIVLRKKQKTLEPVIENNETLTRIMGTCPNVTEKVFPKDDQIFSTSVVLHDGHFISVVDFDTRLRKPEIRDGSKRSTTQHNDKLRLRGFTERRLAKKELHGKTYFMKKITEEDEVLMATA